MKTQELWDFLCQENIGLSIIHGEFDFADLDLGYRYIWIHGSDTVNVYCGSENVDCFTMNDATLPDVLRGIKEYRTDKGA